MSLRYYNNHTARDSCHYDHTHVGTHDIYYIYIHTIVAWQRTLLWKCRTINQCYTIVISVTLTISHATTTIIHHVGTHKMYRQ